MKTMADAVHWADIVAESMLKENSKHLVAMEIIPSGNININNIREAVTADAVYKALLDKEEDADFICIADNFYPLQKVYSFLPESYIEHVGKPISGIPCPCGTCANYAEHFLKPSLEALNRIGINPRVYRTDEIYQAGRYNEAIKTALIKREIIAKILEDFSGKATAYNWSPFNPVCGKCGKITKTKVMGFDPEAETVEYTCACGHSGTVHMAGGGKLTRSMEWPARWAIFRVTTEPLGKDFSSKGSSYDTVKRIAQEIFGTKAPYPIICGQIMPGKRGIVNLPNETVISPTNATFPVSDLFEIMPPEILRYMIIRTRPEKPIYLDPGQNFLTITDEYDRLRTHFRRKDPSFGIFESRICELSRLTDICHSEISFRHMVTIYQVARGNFDQILKIVRRLDCSPEYEKYIKELIDNVSRWLELCAPPFVKFKVKETVPVQAATLSELQKAFLSAFSAHIRTRERLSAEEFHMLIYSAKKEDSELNIRILEKINKQTQHIGSRDVILQIEPGDLFRAIYISLLGKNSGPRAGWFLSSFEKEFLVKRFNEASAYSPGKQ